MKAPDSQKAFLAALFLAGVLVYIALYSDFGHVGPSPVPGGPSIP